MYRIYILEVENSDDISIKEEENKWRDKLFIVEKSQHIQELRAF